MQRMLSLASAGALVLLLGLLLRLAAQQAEGPTHVDLRIAEWTPATLYLPPRPGARAFGLPEPAPEGERPMAVVLAHGFASDRANMSPLARSLANAGYAVLALDLAGHGENRRAGGFRAARSHPKSDFHDELEAAVDYLRASPLVDGARIAVMGHSMGAGAALGYASWDPTIDGAVMIAGGWRIAGPHAPANALFVYAEGDRRELHDGVKRLASRLAGGASLADGEVHGDFANGTAVAHVMVAGASHVGIVADDAAVREIVRWLDAIDGRDRAQPAGLDDPRRATAALGALLAVLVLPGLGLACARLAPGDALGARAPAAPARPGDAPAGAVELGVLVASLVAALPAIALGSPLPALSLEIGELAVPYLSIAGALALAGLAALGRLDVRALVREPAAALAAGAAGGVALLLLLAPLGCVFHGLALTPARAAIALACAALLLPAFLALEGGVRRGGLARGVALSLAGRLLVVGALAAATALGVLPRVVSLMLPILGSFLLVLELPCAAMRAGGGRALLAASFQAVVLGWVLAAVLPVSV